MLALLAPLLSSCSWVPVAMSNTRIKVPCTQNNILLHTNFLSFWQLVRGGQFYNMGWLFNVYSSQFLRLYCKYQHFSGNTDRNYYLGNDVQAQSGFQAKIVFCIPRPKLLHHPVLQCMSDHSIQWYDQQQFKKHINLSAYPFLWTNYSITFKMNFFYSSPSYKMHFS